MVWIVVFLNLLQLCGAEGTMRPDLPYNVTELEVRVEILEVEVENMEVDISNIEIDINQQDDRITVVEATTFDNTNDIADLSSSVEDTEDTIVLLLQRMSALEASNNLQQEQIDTMQVTIDEQSGTIAALEEVNAEQSETIELLRSTDNSTATRLDTVEDEMQAHDSELGTLTETMAVLENTVDDVEDAMTSIEVQNEDLQERITAVEEIVLVPWVACTSSPCDNGGSCIDVNVDTFICMCRDGFYGDTCQYTPTEACASSPCENRGSCIDVNVETFTCLCRDGFFGVNCEQSFSDTSFLATFDVTTLTPSDPIVFNYAVLNEGGHYDVTSGIYTVPLDGIYEFVVHIYGLNDYAIGVWLTVDVDDVTYTHAEGDTTYDERLLESTVLLPLTTGQEVWVRPSTLSSMYGASSSNGMYSWFSAHLVHAV